jgi:hypothetical protein
MDSRGFTLTQKLLFAFGLISLITVLEAGVVLTKVHATDDRLQEIASILIPQADRIAELEKTIFRASLETRHAMLMRTEAKREATLTEIGRLKG